MPSEPLRWDRKDFFKDRKCHSNNKSHHQSDRTPESLLGGSGGNGGGSLTRWRDYHSSHHHSRDFSGWGSVDFRRSPGHGKQEGWHLFAEESGHGYAPSRSIDKMPEDESTRISVSCGDGKYGRNSRENRSSSGQRDWKGHAWDMSNGCATTPWRLRDENCDQRSVDCMLINTWDHIQHDNKIGGVNRLGTGQRCERENSLDWKIKWTRSGSLSSRGSGLSHSSSSKSMGGVDFTEGKTDFQPKNAIATLFQSPSGDAANYVSSVAPSGETTSRKKPRLGWGEGLAKYEEKKVEVPDVSVNNDGVFSSTGIAEPLPSPNLVEKSPRVMGVSDCALPATPSSVACSSSPGVEEKAFGKAVNVGNDGSTSCGSLSIGSQNHLEGSLFNLEKLDTNSIGNLGSSLVDLLQCDDPILVDSSFVQSTAMNKLLVWKGDVLKTLETIEAEIDSLENELKSLKFALGSSSPCPATSTSLSVEVNANQFTERDIVSISIAQPASLQIDCGDVSVEKMLDYSHGLEEIHADGEDADIDSPGTATSKFVEPSSFEKPISPPEMIKNGESFGVLDVIHTMNTEVKCIVPGSLKEGMAGVSTCGDGGMLTESKYNAPAPSDCRADADGDNVLRDVILGANKELGNEASEVLKKLFPRDHSNVEISGVANVFCCHNDSLINEKIAKRKQFLKFKERILTLKFKAFQNLWKEDLLLLTIRKYRVRSQKKSELSVRTTYSGYQKHRSSMLSRFSSPAAGNLSLVPTTEVINFTSKQLSDSQIKVYRESLKMPALMLDEKEKIMSRFISINGLVEDPCAVEKERSMTNPWTPEEREIFLAKLATFGKDFRKIASFIDYKTTADCVEFYYKNHKSDYFKKLKKKQDFSKQGKTSAHRYLVTSGKRNRKMTAASLDILGEASAMAAAAQSYSCQLINSGRIYSGGQCDSRTSLGNDGLIERSSSLDFHGSERETAAAADVLADICGALSSEAISSCITSSVEPGGGQWDGKHQKVDSVTRLPSKSDFTQNIDDDTCSDDSCGEMDPSDWTDEEKSIFVQAVSSYGKDFSMIALCVRTRSRDQCKVFFSKARKCLGLDLIHTGNVGTSVNDDANGGGSDTEDACVLETSSVICSDKLGSKMDEVLPTHVINSNQDESCPTGAMNLQTDLKKSEDDSGMALLDDKDSEAGKPLIYDACKSESKSFELESNCMNSMDKQSESVLDRKNVVLFKTAVREQVAEQGTVLVSSGEAIDSPSNSNVVEETNDVVAEASTKGFGNGLEKHELIIPENSLNDEWDKNRNVDASGESEMVQDSNTTGSAFDLYVDTSSHSVSSKLDSVDNPPVISLTHENSLPVAASVSQDSSDIQCEKTFIHDRLSSTPDLQRSKDKSVHKSVSSNDYQQHLSGHSIMNYVESPEILNYYPLPNSTKKEMNGDICRQLSEIQSISKSDRNIDGPYLAQDCYLQKCSSMLHSSITEPPLQNIERTSDRPQSHSCRLSDTEKPCKNGDVKLFGKILGHPSSSQKSTSSSHENGEKGHHHKQSSKASNLKFSANHPADVGAALLKFDCNNYVGLENVPVRSYGFWDGNRIQTGFSSLPDSAILLAKYPAAFSSFPAALSKMEQQSLQASSCQEQ